MQQFATRILYNSLLDSNNFLIISQKNNNSVHGLVFWRLNGYDRWMTNQLSEKLTRSLPVFFAKTQLISFAFIQLWSRSLVHCLCQKMEVLSSLLIGINWRPPSLSELTPLIYIYKVNLLGLGGLQLICSFFLTNH